MAGSYNSFAPPQTITSATYDAANQLSNHNGTTLTYDANGSLTNDGTSTYTWNARGELTGMAANAFAYDAAGRRRQKTIAGTTTRFVYDGANVVQEKQGGTATANMLTGGVDQVFRRTDSNGSRTLVPGALGSTLYEADGAGNSVASYSYGPFGNTSVTGATNNPTRYTGREDDSTGLYFYRARYYSPKLSRFISQDPMGFAAGDLNLYAYVGQNPVNLTDPSGLCAAGGSGGGISGSSSIAGRKSNPPPWLPGPLPWPPLPSLPGPLPWPMPGPFPWPLPFPLCVNIGMDSQGWEIREQASRHQTTSSNPIAAA